MSRPVSRDFACDCGRTFAAPVYRSANVTTNPGLKNAIMGDRFNVVECPSCHARRPADVPFLYHDMGADLAVWVYPASAVGQEAEIKARIRRAGAILTASVGEGLRSRAQAGKEVIFGIDSLRRLIEGR